MKTRKGIVFAGLITMLLALSACGKGVMTINDGGVSTEIEVSLPKTVDKILESAEIVLNEGDEVTPSLDTKLSEASTIEIARKNTVKLTIDGETREVTRVGGTVQDLLNDEKITLSANQHVSPEPEKLLTNGMEVLVTSLYHVTLVHDGQTEEEDVEARKVADVLADFNVELGADDRLEPAADTEITDGMEIVVNRVTFKEETETEEIDFETVREDDWNLAQGTEQVSVEGVKGERTRTYKVTLVDDKEESREVLSEEVTKEPVNEVIKVGQYVEQQQTYDGGGSGGGESSGGVVEVSRVPVYNCNGDGHGYYEITYSDGSVAYVEF